MNPSTIRERLQDRPAVPAEVAALVALIRTWETRLDLSALCDTHTGRIAFGSVATGRVEVELVVTIHATPADLQRVRESEPWFRLRRS